MRTLACRHRDRRASAPGPAWRARSAYPCRDPASDDRSAARRTTRCRSGRGGRRRAVAGPVAGRPRSYDPRAAREGDRRNVVDRYRYWRHRGDRRRPRHRAGTRFHVAIENWQHDFNIGSVVRTANAFIAAAVHIVGRRRWNRRGRDGHRPLPARAPPPDVGRPRGAGRARRTAARRCVGIDNLPGLGAARDVRAAAARACLLFGQEGPGLSDGGARRPATAVLASPSSARPARSTPAPPPRSPCTPGSGAHAPSPPSPASEDDQRYSPPETGYDFRQHPGGLR